jgi:hypothetical protein
MRTRIKYYQYSDTLMTDWFTVGPNLIVRGVIEKRDCSQSNSGYIVRVVTFDSEVVYTDSKFNLRSAKLLVRKQLILSGVKLGEEIKVISSTI